MTKFGVGPQFTVISILYSIIIFTIDHLYLSKFNFVIVSQKVNIILGVILIGIGIVIFSLSIFAVARYFSGDRLYTKGVYSFMRHPMYGAWVVYITPGIILISGSILGISIPIFMYIVFNILIVKEERYLEEKFGREYLEYKKRVGALFPRILQGKR